MGELGRAVLDEEGPEGWPEFLPYVLQAAASTGGASNNDSSTSNNSTTRNSSGNSNSSINRNSDINSKFKNNLNMNGNNVNSNVNGGGGSLQAGSSPAAVAAAVVAPGGAGGAGGSNGGEGTLARVVTGLRLMSSAAQHVAIAAAADPSAFQVLVETLQRCLCWQPQQQQQETGMGTVQKEGGVAGGGGDGTGFQDVRLEAVRALGSVVVACARPSEQTAFSTCLPHLMQAIQGGTLGKGVGRGRLRWLRSDSCASNAGVDFCLRRFFFAP